MKTAKSKTAVKKAKKSKAEMRVIMQYAGFLAHIHENFQEDRKPKAQTAQRKELLAFIAANNSKTTPTLRERYAAHLEKQRAA